MPLFHWLSYEPKTVFSSCFKFRCASGQNSGACAFKYFAFFVLELDSFMWCLHDYCSPIYSFFKAFSEAFFASGSCPLPFAVSAFFVFRLRSCCSGLIAVYSLIPLFDPSALIHS